MSISKSGAFFANKKSIFQKKSLPYYSLFTLLHLPPAKPLKAFTVKPFSR